MTATNSNTDTERAERVLVITRVFDAPRALVWKAWTEPERLARWWGPSGFTNPVCEVDLRPGGTLRIVMRGPDGADYPMTGVFREVVAQERLVFTNAPVDAEGHPLLDGLTTVLFADEGRRTRVTLETRAVALVDGADMMLDGMEEGWNQSLDRLAEHVVSPDGSVAAKPAYREFIFTRTFDAPRDLVWAAWTERERLEQWWGPAGCTMLSCKIDLRPGGVFHYGMRTPDGSEMWGKWTFSEIAASERLVFIVSFSDAAGGVTRHPLAPDWPAEVLSTVTFVEHEGRTTIAMRGVPHGATESENKLFEDGRESMKQGWTGTADQLAAYLAKAQSQA